MIWPLLLILGSVQAARQAPLPNIVFILVDDLGEAGVPFNNPLLQGDARTALREEGVLLRRHYVYKFCSPTRGSLLSGRYPFRLGNTRSNFIPWSRPDCLNTAFDLLPQRLRRLGYSTAHVGKWVCHTQTRPLVRLVSTHSHSVVPCLPANDNEASRLP